MKKKAKPRARAKSTAKRKVSRRTRSVTTTSDESDRRAIIAELERLERQRHAEWDRRSHELEALEARPKAVAPERILQARIRLHDASLEIGEVLRLRRELEDILRDAAQRLAVIEVEVRFATTDALARYRAAKAKRAAGPSRGLSQHDLANELVKAKHAVAIVIADRDKMRAELAALAATPERAAEAEEWRLELALQEAAVTKLKEALRMLSVAAAGRV